MITIIMRRLQAALVNNINDNDNDNDNDKDPETGGSGTGTGSTEDAPGPGLETGNLGENCNIQCKPFYNL